MLLMAGLMLADRTAAYEERARVAEEKLAEMERRITALEAGGIPPEAMARLAALADRAEALARDAEEAGAA
jgi:cell division protein ZapA